MERESDGREAIQTARSESAPPGPETTPKQRRLQQWLLPGAVSVLLIAAIAHIGPLEILRQVMIRVTEDTAFAPGYSERAFRKIAAGDTETSVRAALGTPLRERGAEPYVRWLYAPDPVHGFEEDGNYPDIRFSFTTIDFGEDGTFADAFGQISHGSSSNLVGVSGSATFLVDGGNPLSLTNAEIEKLRAEKATPEQIEARFGKPRAIFESRVAKWLQYSHSPGSNHYRQRLVGMDRGGKVCRKVDKIWWD